LGKYLPCIAPLDVMVVDFGVKNQDFGIVKSFSFEASIQKTQNRPSNQLI
jgi:hypothetical protein